MHAGICGRTLDLNLGPNSAVLMGLTRLTSEIWPVKCLALLVGPPLQGGPKLIVFTS
jgi:hypothetical protein